MAVRPVDGSPRSITPTQTTAVEQPARPAASAPAQAPAAAAAAASQFTAPAAQSNALSGASNGYVPLKSMSPSNVAVTPRSIDLSSPEAQKAIDAALRAQGSGGIVGPFMTGQGYAARSVSVDDYGLTHVRLDRTYKGLKVFGEQVVTTLDRDGKVVSNLGDTAQPAISWDAAAPGKVSAQAALETAQKAFGAQAEKVTQEEVMVKNAAGEYVRAHHISLTNLSSGDPREQHYLVDANTGKVMDNWNQIDTFIKKSDLDRAGLNADGSPRAEPVTVTASATPNAPIEDMGTTTSTVNVDADLDLTQLKLNLDVNHTWRGDLKVTVTSPSGKEYVVSNRQGGSADDIKGEFDLTEAFKGEPTKGEWKITIQDMAKRDVGTLNSWGLTLTGTDKTPPEPDKKDDTTLYSGKVEIGDTKQADGTYKLEDDNRGKGVLTKDAHNKYDRTGATEMFDNNGIWGEVTDDARSKAAVDAQYGGQMTYDFYKQILGRDSIDGKGEALVSNVHIRTNYVNAYWDGQQMNYGDGDGGKNSTELTSLDVAGHEISHGLTERTAGLIYRGESGGLNEAISDIMGKGVEWLASQQNPDVKFTWGVGERIWTPNKPGDALRYMDDPTKDKYSIDNYKNYPKQTEVHGSSGIANNAFVLLVQGGTNRTSGIEVKGGIGMEPALKIFGRALTTYMTPSTTFAQARQATIQAATDMYGADSAEVAKVKEAWTAVGVN